MLEYPAKIKYNKKDDAYEVEFPDLSGCVTFGETLEDVILPRNSINFKFSSSDY